MQFVSADRDDGCVGHTDILPNGKYGFLANGKYGFLANGRVGTDVPGEKILGSPSKITRMS